MKNKKNYFFLIALGILLSGCSSPTIQKKINVTESLRSWDSYYGNMLDNNKDNLRNLSLACLDISISKETFDSLLERGSKVITSTKWTSGQQEYKYFFSSGNPSGYMEKGTCIGYTYIIEGPKKLLEKYYAKD